MGVKKGSLNYWILFSLEKAIDGSVRLEDFNSHSWLYAYGIPPALKKSALSQAIKRLRERGLLEVENNTDQIIFKLTSLGKEALCIDDFKEEDWDGFWRIVIFDIPEKKRVIRNLFRRRLKSWGFIHWQQSVWATKKDITTRLRNLITDLKIEEWVAVIESDNVSVGNKILNGRPI